MKKTRIPVAALLALLLLAAFAVFPAAEDAAPESAPVFAQSDYYCSLRADIDGDGSVTAADARLLLRCAVRLEKIDYSRINAYNLDGNTTVTAQDARTALRIAVGLESRPAHKKGDDVTVREATCQQTGSTAFRCVYCGELYSEGVLPIRPHTADVWETDKKATCTAAGMRVKRCMYCGVVFDREEIPKTPHIYGDIQYYDTPDCSRGQLIYQLCIFCGDKKEGFRPVMPHTYIWETVREATCTAQGKKIERCTVCGAESGAAEILPALGHQPSDMIYVSYPTTTEEGLIRVVCTRCGEILSEVILPPKTTP